MYEGSPLRYLRQILQHPQAIGLDAGDQPGQHAQAEHAGSIR